VIRRSASKPEKQSKRKKIEFFMESMESLLYIVRPPLYAAT
jgi:hypothetical protein